MKSSYRVLFLVLPIVSACFLIACTRDWDLMIVDDKQGNPVFCFSSFLGKCTGRGDWHHSIFIDEVDAKGEKVQKVWYIDCLPENPDHCVLERLEYGVLPRGWEQEESAKTLSSDTYYSVNGYYYFSRNNRGEYTVMRMGEFYKNVVRKE